MNRAAEKLDEERYETIYADPDQKESVAAPTAGMHFDQELLNALQKKGVEFGYVQFARWCWDFSASQNRSY